MHTRQKHPPQTALRQYGVTVIGLGGVGRQVALQLAALGVGQVQLVESATVRSAPRVAAGYFAEDAGRRRAHATAELCHRLRPELAVEAVVQPIFRGLACTDAVFCCSDSLPVRRAAWRLAGEQVKFFADVGVTVEAVRVLTVWNASGQSTYARSLARQHRAPARLIPVPFHVAGLAAGLAVLQFCNYLSGRKPPYRLRLDLRALKLAAASHA